MTFILATMPSFSTFLGGVVVVVALALPASSFGFADTAANTTAPHAMTVDDIEHLLDVGSPQLSPDGKWIAYTVRRVDTKADKNITFLSTRLAIRSCRWCSRDFQEGIQ